MEHEGRQEHQEHTRTELTTPHLPKGAGGWLLVVVFVAGAALMSFELVGSRILAPFFGNSIYVWGSLIGVFLGALSMGYFVGGRIADRHPHAGALAFVLALSAVLTALVVLVSDPLQSAVVRWNPGIRLNPLLSAVALFGPASILMGMVSPFAVRLSSTELAKMGSTAGALYGLSTVGSIVGTIGTSFWLVGNVGTDNVVLLVALSLGACSLISALAAAGGRATAVSLGALLVVLVLGGSGAAGGTERQSVRTGNNSPVLKAAGFREEFQPRQGGKERLHEDSQYHRIRVVDYTQGVEPGRGAARLLHFDNSMQAAIELGADGEPVAEAPPVFSYLAAVDMLPQMRPDAERALFIGLGSGAAPMRLRQLMPDVKVDVVEIDPEVVDVAREWFAYDDKGPNVSTHVGDGRSWLAASGHQYDIVMIDAYYADSIPFHLTTREFLDVVRDHLRRDGVVYANLIGAVEGRRSDLLRSFVKTYRDRFDEVELYPVTTTAEPPDLRRFANVELFATDGGGISLGAAEVSVAEGGDSGALGVDWHPALARLIKHRYPSALPLGGVPVLTDDYAPVDALSIHEGDS